MPINRLFAYITQSTYIRPQPLRLRLNDPMLVVTVPTAMSVRGPIRVLGATLYDAFSLKRCLPAPRATETCVLERCHRLGMLLILRPEESMMACRPRAQLGALNVRERVMLFPRSTLSPPLLWTLTGGSSSSRRMISGVDVRTYYKGWNINAQPVRHSSLTTDSISVAKRGQDILCTQMMPVMTLRDDSMPMRALLNNWDCIFFPD